jgi:hypothetical protein
MSIDENAPGAEPGADAEPGAELCGGDGGENHHQEHKPNGKGAQAQSADDITALRLTLRENGYSPIPCVGKIPTLNAWQESASATEDEIKRWPSLFKNCCTTPQRGT